jgi:tetratricopeptide (TPR) repeat protein
MGELERDVAVLSALEAGTGHRGAVTGSRFFSASLRARLPHARAFLNRVFGGQARLCLATNFLKNFPVTPDVPSSTHNGRGRKALLTLALLASAVFLPKPAFAGGEPGAFMQWGAGARSLAMGRAFLAISDDASATYWNPAAMTQLKRKELMVLQANMFQQTTYGFVSYVHPTAKGGVWGFNLTQLNSGGFEKVKITFDPASSPDNPDVLSMENDGSFVVSQQAFTLAYGKQVTSKINMGLAVKRITNTVDTFQQAFTAVDASVFSKVSQNYRVGLSVKNAVTQAPANSGDRLPLILRVGNAYSLLNNRIVLAADINSSAYDGLGWNLGTEYWVSRKLAVRLGLENRAGLMTETTAGLGLNLRSFTVDLGVGLTELGMSQRFSVGWKFGKSAEDGREDGIRNLVKQGNAAFNKGNYGLAASKLEAALAMDPGNKNLQGMLAKLQGIAGSIPAASGDGDVDRLVRQGVSAYVAGDLQAAYDSLRTAYEKNPSNQNLMNLTNRVARLAGQPLVEPPRDTLSGARWTLVDQKLHDALQSIYEGRYDVTIQKCEQVLRIDPSNVTAIGRMGAAFFLMGEKDKAIVLWKRALELEPNNQTAVEYLKQLGAQ